MFIDLLLSEIALDEEDTTQDTTEDTTEDTDYVDEDLGEDTDEDEDEESDEGSADKKQTKKADSAFANYRKENEELKGKLEYYNKFFGNVYGQYGVKDLESFEKMYKADLEKQKLEQEEEIYREAEDAGISKDKLIDIIEKLPIVKELKKNNEELTKIKEEIKIRDKMNVDFEELKTDFPQFKTIDDIYKLPSDTLTQIYSKIGKGNSLLEAFLIVNHKGLLDDAVKTGKQKALNDINGKSHLKNNNKGSGEDVDITSIDDETLRWYKTLMPNASKKQILEHYKKSK